MGTIRSATLGARPTDLANITITTPQGGATLVKLLADRVTEMYRVSNSLRYSRDHGVTVTAIQSFNDGTWRLDAVQETPHGELLVSLSKSGQPGEVWRSTGWNLASATATSWARVWQGRAAGIVANGQWGLQERALPPSWSKHAGMMFLSEYGPQTNTVASSIDAAVRVWASDDDGVTWRSIFDLRTMWPAADNLHVHAVAYDPWNNRLLVSHGDGGGSGASTCGIFYTDNPEATTPTWTLVPTTNNALGYKQSTTIMAVESGVIVLPDGRPQGVRLLPRRGPGRYGPLREVAAINGYGNLANLVIGGFLHRAGGLEDPVPGAPILMNVTEPSAGSGIYSALWISTDGLKFRELYRHGSVVGAGSPGFLNVFGPTLDGKIISSFNVAGTNQIFVADYLPVAASVAPLASGATSADVQVFTSSGTWTKPTGAKAVEVMLMSGGGGGASGRRGAAGTVRCGGGGGAGGATSTALLRASDLPATVPIGVGTGGAPGAAITANDTNGSNGNAGTASSFGSYARANGGGLGGSGGTASTGTGGGQSTNAGGIGPSMAGGAASVSGGIGGAGNGQGAATAGNQYAGTGGGAGGGITTADVAGNGGAGGVNTYTNNLTAPGGIVDSTAPTTTNALMPGPGSGGGGGAASITTAAQAGAVGGTYGSGGGGGGASLNGNNSGAGGNGSPGVVVVTTYF